MSKTGNLEDMLKNLEISAGLKIQPIQGQSIYEFIDFMIFFQNF